MMKRFLMLALLAVPFLATVAKADDAAPDAKKKKSHKEKKADKKADKAAPAPAAEKPAGGDEMK